MGVLDSSFLFLPFGNDLLVVALVSRNHHGYLFYVLSAMCGSTFGVFLLDYVARKLGEQGVTRVAGQRRFDYLKRKIGQRGGIAIVAACLAPPPFPFSMAVSVNSALAYPRRKLLLLVAASRGVRFLILGALALRFGTWIIRIANSPVFRGVMIGFVLICLIGSVMSIASWVRKGRSARPRGEAPQPSRA